MENKKFDNYRFTELLEAVDTETLAEELASYPRPVLTHFIISGFLADLAFGTDPLLTDIDFPGRTSPETLDIITAVLALSDSDLINLARQLLAEI